MEGALTAKLLPIHMIRKSTDTDRSTGKLEDEVSLEFALQRLEGFSQDRELTKEALVDGQILITPAFRYSVKRLERATHTLI